MKRFTLPVLLLGAAFSLNAQQQEYVIFEDDMSWLLPWANALNANGQACGDPIGKNDVSDAVSVSRALNNIKIEVDGTEVSADQKVLEMGYELLINKKAGMANKVAGNAVYLQRDLNDEDEATGVYLKFGLTGYSSGIKTPELTNAGEGITGFTVSFDWTPQRQAGGKYDTTHLAVCVNDNTTVGEGRENVPDLTLENNEPLKWRHEDIRFDSYTITKNDKISIRPGANQWPGGETAAFRFYLRNLKITTTTPIATGITGIEAEDNAPVEYYNLQGIRIAEPAEGICIVRQGNKVSKKFIRK